MKTKSLLIGLSIACLALVAGSFLSTKATANAIAETFPVIFWDATIGYNGTATTGIWHGDTTIASGATTGTVTLTGVTATDKVVATISSGNSSGVFVKTAIPGTDSVAITLSGTPGASTNIDVIAVRPRS